MCVCVCVYVCVRTRACVRVCARILMCFSSACERTRTGAPDITPASKCLCDQQCHTQPPVEYSGVSTIRLISLKARNQSLPNASNSPETSRRIMSTSHRQAIWLHLHDRHHYRRRGLRHTRRCRHSHIQHQHHHYHFKRLEVTVPIEWTKNSNN